MRVPLTPLSFDLSLVAADVAPGDVICPNMSHLMCWKSFGDGKFHALCLF